MKAHSSNTQAVQPFVVIGGFLSSEKTYQRMRRSLQEISGQKVWVVPLTVYAWFGSISLAGWIRILDKIEDAVIRAVRESNTGKVTLIGHSSGGILGRLFLSPEPLRGHAYNGLEHVNSLITLGSPHYNHKGATLRKWVEKKYPGSYFEPKVQYISVAGKSILGNRKGSLMERLVYFFYKTLCGNGAVWGDGLVPVPSALLHGSRHIIVDDIRHYSRAKHPWYGSDKAVWTWWNAINTDNQ